MKNTHPSKSLSWLSALFLSVFATSTSLGYEVWFGLPYIPKGSQDVLSDQWDMVAPQLEGINTNAVDTQRPDSERNTRDDWRAIVQQMSLGKDNAVLEFARTHFAYDGFGGDRRDSLAEESAVKFRRENWYDLSIKWVMPFDNQPGEDRTLPVEEWTDADLQELRDWLDNTGRADVRIISNVRNNGARSRSFSQKAIVEGVSIEARAQLWFENNGSRQDYLLWALGNALVQDKTFKFQVPFNTNNGDSGFQGMREFMRWLSTSAMLGSTDFIRRDDVVFMVITYSDNFPLLPETSPDGSLYEPTLFSTALSIIEQRDLFEGRGPGGLISLEQALSYDRFEVVPGPDSGLVAHWPLDEGSGTTTANASGFGTEASLLNGASWASDATRGAHVVFDGNDDRIETAFSYALKDSDDFTWAWWAKKESTSHPSSIMVGNRYGGSGSESLEFIKFMPNKAAFADTGSAANIEDYNYSDLPSNQWHHYAMVKNGTSYQWYVDGVAQGSPVTINYNETAPLPFLIGGDGDNKPNEHFEGAIDDVVLYREALTPTQINDVINGIYLPVVRMVAGWDTWNSSTGPVANVTGSGITATASTTTAAGSWNTTDDGSSGRGSSGDATWGSFDGDGVSASDVTSGTGANMTASNGVETAELTLTIANDGGAAWDLDSFHMDVIAFRPNAPRAYQLEVVSGDLTNGVVFTSADDAITQFGGNLSGNHDDHDEIDLSFSGLADSTLEAGEAAVIRVSFSSGTGSGGGHHLFLDNVAVSGVMSSISELQSWRLLHFGNIENSGSGADSADPDGDGESNLLEFATGQNPLAASRASFEIREGLNGWEFTYPRSLEAVADGLGFFVEWSDTLSPESWKREGVEVSLESVGDGVENMLARIPEGAEKVKFVRLVVSP